MFQYCVALGWFCAFIVSAGIIYSANPVLQMDWNSPFLDGVINSFSRPGWAACLGWMIFACTHGYGGKPNYDVVRSLIYAIEFTLGSRRGLGFIKYEEVEEIPAIVAPLILQAIVSELIISKRK